MTTRPPLSAGLNRRRFLQLGAAGAALTAVPLSTANADTKVATKAHIVIAGAGAAGLSAAQRLMQKLDGARVTIIDKRKEHFYQPGFTLIAGGIKSKDYVVSSTAEYLPRDVTWIEEGVAEFDPDSNKVVTDSGKAVTYDYLVLATGLRLDYDAIEGMDVTRIGTDGLGSIYASPDAASATWGAMARFVETGGVGLFGRPDTEMKCAGAPLKYTFITDDRLRRAGNRSKAELIYCAQNKSLFSVPIVSEKVRMLFGDRKVKVNHDHVMTGIDLGRKMAFYKTPTGTAELKYDFINVVPPMRAAEAVRNSALRWQDGAFAADGWAEVEKPTLRHRRYPNVFAVGDVAGVPKGKTAASVKWQVPVAVDHLVADIAGTTSTAVYNGYTSCPLITRLGRAMLVEFDYNNDLVPSFPGVIAPLEELWITWVMKTMALKPTYISMLRGRA